MTERGSERQSASTVTVEVRSGIAIVTVRDAFSAATIIESRKDLMARPDFVRGMPVLYTLQEMTTVELTRDDLRTMENHGRETVEQRGTHLSAVHAPRDVDFGMARMYALMSERDDSLRIFRDYDEAFAWLKASLNT